MVNAFGDVLDRTGQIVAGARYPDASFADTVSLIARDGLLRRAVDGLLWRAA